MNLVGGCLPSMAARLLCSRVQPCGLPGGAHWFLMAAYDTGRQHRRPDSALILVLALLQSCFRLPRLESTSVSFVYPQDEEPEQFEAEDGGPLRPVGIESRGGKGVKPGFLLPQCVISCPFLFIFSNITHHHKHI